MSEQENAVPGLAEYPVRASIDMTAKGQLTPKFSFAYKTNADLIANLRRDYMAALKELIVAAYATGQEIAGAPRLPGVES